jgi:hypothetical protein
VAVGPMSLGIIIRVGAGVWMNLGIIIGVVQRTIVHPYSGYG